MKPFLKQVAEKYALNEDLATLQRFCFIFPNRRSASFFQHYLNESIKRKPLINTLTIGSFAAKFSPYREAPRIEQIFILYNEYRKFLNVEEMNFDKFSFWGNMILDDFDDVDRFLVKPEKIFENIRRVKEIRSTYLSEEQIEVLSRYLKTDFFSVSTESFWTHIRENWDKNLEQKFISLWNILGELYSNFHQTMTAKELITSGQQYRNAAIVLKKGEDLPQSLNFERFVFIGFNALSTSEFIMLDSLRNRGKADFYWDIDTPVFDKDFNDLIVDIKQNSKIFPSRYPLERQDSGSQSIVISAIPGNIAQLDYVSSKLSDWLKDEPADRLTKTGGTAVVLPDESLFSSLLYVIPDKITDINVTMGLPMRDNPLNSLMKSIDVLQKRVAKVDEEMKFYYEDVVKVLSFPAVRDISPEEAEAVEKKINDKRLFHISPEEIEEEAPSYSFIFRIHKNEDYINKITGYLENIIIQIGEHIDKENLMGRAFVTTYQKKLDEVRTSVLRHDIPVNGKTVFRLIEKAISQEKLHFSGKSTDGLQILGVNETRSLDFENIIITSMNEDIMPKRNHSSSFIPDIIRKGYALPTSDFQENLNAYLFYRLISRANKIELTYDARKGGLKSGEFSRYISQLLYLGGFKNISHRLLNYDIPHSSFPRITVKKSKDIQNKLKAFTSEAPEDKRKYLSASSLNTYISCPLEFYLRYVEGYNADDEMHDFIDASTYGSIVHDVVQGFYESFREEGSKKSVIVNKDDLLKHLKNSDTLIDSLIVKSVNKRYNKFGDNCLTQLRGEAQITGEIIREMVRNMIKAEIDFTPIEFIDAESNIYHSYKVNDSLAVNIHQYIDRIDRITKPDGSSQLRIVDYKTGSDVLFTTSIERLFQHKKDKNPKAIMQLLFYCLIYSERNKSVESIQPIIYKMHEIGKKGIENLTLNDGGKSKGPMLNHNDYMEDFEKELKKLISEIFDPETPFVAAPDDSSCKFCSFKSLCRRDPE